MSRPAKVSGLDFRPSDRVYGEGSIYARPDSHTIYIIRPIQYTRKVELTVRAYGEDILLAAECAKATAVSKAHADWFGK